RLVADHPGDVLLGQIGITCLLGPLVGGWDGGRRLGHGAPRIALGTTVGGHHAAAPGPPRTVVFPWVPHNRAVLRSQRSRQGDPRRCGRRRSCATPYNA